MTYLNLKPVLREYERICDACVREIPISNDVNARTGDRYSLIIHKANCASEIISGRTKTYLAELLTERIQRHGDLYGIPANH